MHAVFKMLHMWKVVCTDDQISYRKNHISTTYFEYRYQISTMIEKAADTYI